MVDKKKLSDFKSRSIVYFKEVIASYDKNAGIDKEIEQKITVIFIALHFAAFVQSVGFFVQNTSYPYLTKCLGVSPQVYGYTLSFSALMNLFGGPLCGWASDIYGGRLTLIAAFVALIVSYFILGISNSIAMLFIAKIPRLVAHPLQSMYLIISDITYPEGRADMMGKLGVSSGLGMIIGSAIGGQVTSHFGNRAPFFVSIAILVICIVASMAMIPGDTKYIYKHMEKKRKELETFNKKSTDDKLGNPTNSRPPSIMDKSETTCAPPLAKSKKAMFLNGLEELVTVTKRKHMGYLLILKLITAFPFSVLSAMFTLLLMDYYKLGPRENGMVLSYLGIVGMITQGYLIGLFCRHAADGSLILISCIIMGVGFLYLIISQSIYVFCLTCIPLTIGGSLINIVVTSLITKIVDKEQTGSALGVTLCMHSTVRSISPAIGGFMFQHLGFFTFGVLGYAVNLCVTVYLLFYGREDFSV